MLLRGVGYGAGTRDFPGHPNVLRILIGESDLSERALTSEHVSSDSRFLVEANIDDMNAEMIGYVVQRLWELEPKPLDVWTTAIQMKKQRPGVTLSVICDAGHDAAVVRLLLTETTTLGVRHAKIERFTLARSSGVLPTRWGELQVKRAVLPDGSVRTVPEYESACELARRAGVPLWKIYNTLGDTVGET